MGIKKINSKTILKYVSLAFVFVVLSMARVGEISPFLYAMFFACVFVGLNEKIVAGFALVAGSIFPFELRNFLITLTVVFVGLVMFYIHKLAKRKINIITVFISFVISLATYIYYNFSNPKNVAIYILLGLVALFVYVTILHVLLLRRNCFKLTLDESICFLFALASVGLGVARLYVLDYSVAKLFLTLVMLICVGVGIPTLTYSVVLSFVLGCAVADFNLIIVAEFVILSMLASVFAPQHRVRISAMVILGEAFVQYCFVSHTFDVVTNLAPVCLACLVFLLLPKKLFNSLTDLVYVKKSEITSRNVINTTRKNIRKRMVELSDIFLDMKQIHLGLVKKELSKDELSKMFMREIINSCCGDCIDKVRCTRTLGTANKSSLEAMVEVAINKGKVTLLDIPSGLTNRCAKANNLIAKLNRLCEEYRQYNGMMADVNNVKILMADQMGAVSKLLLDVGEEIDTNVRFDVARENKIISRLLGQNVMCKEVLIYTEKNDEISAVLVVDSVNAYNDNIEKIVSETLKVPMNITKISPLEEQGFYSVQLRKRSKYDCVFGLASCCKAGNDECGDSHSIIRLGSNKFLLALCDGMGAGLVAHKMSAMTLGLIENFYKAGFDNDVILESVNKLLSINNQESYSTLDVCLLDLDKELADFIKVGAPVGFIKRSSGMEMVEGFSLPIGAIESINPTTYKTTISTKDMVIMATDGVVDAFENYEDMQEFISNLVSTNPQVLADTILQEALSRNEMERKDDMTVLVARIYLKAGKK